MKLTVQERKKLLYFLNNNIYLFTFSFSLFHSLSLSLSLCLSISHSISHSISLFISLSIYLSLSPLSFSLSPHFLLFSIASSLTIFSLSLNCLVILCNRINQPFTFFSQNLLSIYKISIYPPFYLSKSFTISKWLEKYYFHLSFNKINWIFYRKLVPTSICYKEFSLNPGIN